MKDVTEMNAGELIYRLPIHPCDSGHDEEFDEMCTRLRGYDAIIEDITSLCDTQWKLHHNGLAPAVMGTMKRAIQSVREVNHD
jgi:hypothetical protein